MKPIAREIAGADRNGEAAAMSPNDSALDPVQISYAKALLTAPSEEPERAWPALASAALAAVAALVLAFAMIAAPPVVSSHVVESAP